MEIHFAQAYSLRLPMVVLFLGTLLLGVLIAGLSQGTLSVKNFFVNLKVVGRNKLQNKVNQTVDEENSVEKKYSKNANDKKDE